MKRGNVTGNRILIINADDLGYARGINQAIQECSVAGILRSATLMANAPAFDDAVAMVRANPELDAGVHLVLTKLPPLAPPSKIGGLAAEGGHLPATPWELLLAVHRGRVSRSAIRQELTCQLTKVFDHGLRPTHLDSHKHVHLIPEVLEVVIELARQFAIPWVRNPFDETPFLPPALQVDRERFITFCTQHLKGRLVRYYRSTHQRLLAGSGVRVPDHFFGVSLTGIWNKAAMIGLMSRLPPGITEWMLHPGTCDEDLLRSGTRLRERRVVEKALLLAPEIPEHLKRHGIILSSFRAEAA